MVEKVAVDGGRRVCRVGGWQYHRRGSLWGSVCAETCVLSFRGRYKNKC